MSIESWKRTGGRPQIVRIQYLASLSQFEHGLLTLAGAFNLPVGSTSLFWNDHHVQQSHMRDLCDPAGQTAT